MVAQTRQVNNSNALKKLQFKDKLISKGSTTDSLLKKLQTLQAELSALEQEHVDVKSLASVRKELIQVTILLHKDKGVKAYAACCLADLLRLYAPDAPYTADELRDIFQFFFRQLSTGLKGPETPYHDQFFQLLESLSTVKSVVLICDLPQADDLITEVFREFFLLVQNNLAKNIELYMADILIALVDESQAVPHAVVDLIMAQFSNVERPLASYHLAVEVCKGTVDKLQRNVCQYFTDIIIQNPKHDETLSEIEVAHRAIKHIHKDCPALLHNVIPQLEEELKVDQPELRLLATQTLGDMFADKNGVEMLKKYPHVWETWQLRKMDRVPAVRISFVEACKGLIVHHPDLRQLIEDALRSRLMDPDEKVRAATCRLYAQLDLETAMHHVSVAQLQAVSERALDKKLNVRLDAMHTLGKLYQNSRPDIEDHDEVAITQFAWIPSTLLHAACANAENMSLVESIFWEYILPLPPKAEEEAAWTDRLVTVVRHLDDRSINILLNMSNLRQPRPTLYQKFIEFCEKYNGGIMDTDEAAITKRLNVVIQHLSVHFSDRAKAAEDLHAFAKLNENRLYKLLQTCMDTQVDLKTLIKSSNEFFRRIEQLSSSIVPTMSTIFRKATLWIINATSVSSLLRRINGAEGPDQEPSVFVQDCSKIKLLLTSASKFCPVIFGLNIEDLKDLLGQENNVAVTEVALRVLVALETELDKKTRNVAIKYAQSAHGKLAKLSARLIARWTDAEAVSSKIVVSISESLTNAAPPTLVGHLAFLAEIAKKVPAAFEQKSDVIISFIVQTLLLQVVSANPNTKSMDETDEWASNEEVSDLTTAKIIGIKICRNRCVVHADSETALANASAVLTMLLNILAHGGSMDENISDDPKVKSRIRLIAATSLLKMAAIPKYCEKIMPHFALLAITLQDTCFQVRYNFLTKLISYLSTNKTDPRFNIAVFLTAHDPEKEVRDKAKGYVLQTIGRLSAEQRMTLFELNFLRLLHVLAHHPDFSIDTQSFKETAKYIEFYLDTIATPENISLLYYLTMRVKMVRDAISEFSKNLYCVGELAQEIIRNRAKPRGWQLNSYTQKVKLPKDIFKPLDSSEAVNVNVKRMYLPEGALTWLQDVGKVTRSPNAKSKAKPSRKRKPNTVANSKSQRKRRRKSYEDDDSEEEKEKTDENVSDDIEEGSGESNASSPERHEPDDPIESNSEADMPEQKPESDSELGRGARGRAKKRAANLAAKKRRSKR